MALSILDIKQRYWQYWHELKSKSLIKKPFEVLEELTKIADKTVLDVISKISINFKNLSILALGGYARKQLFPHSDIDLLILFNGKLTSNDENFVEEFTRSMWDLKINLGIQLKDINEIENDALNDEIFKTSLLDNRFISGSETLYQKFLKILKFNIFGRNKINYLIFKVKNVRQRSKKQSNILYLLEPNIKDSPGGLRDINTIYWICKLLFATTDLSILEFKNILASKDLGSLKKSIDFIYKIRIQLHFFHNRKYDVLNMEAQKNIATILNYIDTSNSLGVEFLMKEYYSAAKVIYKIVNRIINLILSPIIFPKENVSEVTSYLGFGFYKYNTYISFKEPDLFIKNPRKLLLIHYLSIKFKLKISDLAKDKIRQHLYLIDDHFIKKHAHMFIELISLFPNSSVILQNLLETEILQKFIPEFANIECKPQFDYYHHYTVDEHTTMALAKIDELIENINPKVGVYLTVFKEIKRKDLLAFAILFHDIGKGLGKDHSITGSRMAKLIGKRLNLKEEDLNLLSNLVKYHLIMGHIAQRRDINDIDVLKYFLSHINSLEELNILFLLTYADMNSVGGQVYVNWINSLVIQLYLKARKAFTQKEFALDVDRVVDEKTQNLLSHFKNDMVIQKLIKSFDKYYVYTNKVENIITHIELISKIDKENTAIFKVNAHNELDCLEFIICTYDYIGLLRNISAVFLSFNLNILGAQINTFRNGLVIDIIQVTKIGIPVNEVVPLIPEISFELKNIIIGNKDAYTLLREKLKQKFEKKKITEITNKVVFDNSLSKNYTIVDVYTADKVGLLFNLLDRLEKLNINVQKAIISTDVDRVVDSFYITNYKREKIENMNELENIKKILEKTISN